MARINLGRVVGKSAYELALDNGFVGSLNDWLLSLIGEQGASAYEVAVSAGFVGSVSEWLLSLHGVNGKSAYEIALSNGFIGTEQQWLDSLRGADGATDYNDLDNKPDLSVYQTELPIDPTNGSETKYLNEKGQFSEIAIGGISSGVEVINALGYTPENAAKKGAANGYAPLDSSSKVPATNLPSSLEVGAISNQGAYDATKALSGIAIAKEIGTDFKFVDNFIQTNGVATSGGGRSCTDFIRIVNTSDIVFLGESNNMFVNALSFYDKNKTYISGVCNNQTTVSTQTVLSANIPSNACYVRLSTHLSCISNSFVYTGGIQSLLQLLDSKYNILEESVSLKLNQYVGINLFNKSASKSSFTSASNIDTYSKYNIIQNADTHPYFGFRSRDGVNISNKIYLSELNPKAVISGRTYTNGLFIGYFDSNNTLIQELTLASSGLSVANYSSGVSYVRFNYLVGDESSIQIEYGSESTTYRPYTILGFLENINDKIPNRDVVCILPKNMYFVKGKQSNVYYENVLLKNLNDPTSLFFDKGTNYNRQVAFNFGSAGTSQSMVAQVIRNLKKGQSKTITYNVIDPATNNGKIVNALHIGDSFTDMGIWVKETKTLLNAQGVTYNLIGTCGDSTFRAEGLSGGALANTFLNSSAGVGRRVAVTGVTTLPSTSYPGRTYRDANGHDWTIRSGKIDGSGNGYIVVTKYQAIESDFATFPSSGTLTKIGTGEGDATINYSSPTSCYFNPFINPSTGLLDISNYLSTWGLATPNIVAIQFTWNDILTWATDTALATLVSSFKTAADHIHSSLPSAKVVFSIEPYGSINGGMDWNGKKYSVLRFAELMLAQFEDNANYNTWVKIAPSYAFVDLVNGYSGGATVAPCDRYPAVVEASGGDGIHPSTGMYQIADCVSQVISAII